MRGVNHHGSEPRFGRIAAKHSAERDADEPTRGAVGFEAAAERVADRRFEQSMGEDQRLAGGAARAEPGCGGVEAIDLLFIELFERPKAGFAIPVGEWIKGDLRPWVEELLDPAHMAAEGMFDPAIVQRRWRDHLAGQRDSTPALWAVLMFQAWHRAQEGSLSAAA